MKAFLIGLVFLIAVAVLAGIGVLLYPFLVLCGFFLEMLLGLVFMIVAIWALGKLIIYIWEQISKKH